MSSSASSLKPMNSASRATEASDVTVRSTAAAQACVRGGHGGVHACMGVRACAEASPAAPVSCWWCRGLGGGRKGAQQRTPTRHPGPARREQCLHDLVGTLPPRPVTPPCLNSPPAAWWCMRAQWGRRASCERLHLSTAKTWFPPRAHRRSTPRPPAATAPAPAPWAPCAAPTPSPAAEEGTTVERGGVKFLAASRDSGRWLQCWLLQSWRGCCGCCGWRGQWVVPVSPAFPPPTHAPSTRQSSRRWPHPPGPALPPTRAVAASGGGEGAGRLGRALRTAGFLRSGGRGAGAPGGSAGCCCCWPRLAAGRCSRRSRGRQAWCPSLFVSAGEPSGANFAQKQMREGLLS